MSIAGGLGDALLALAVAASWLAVAAFLRVKDPFNRLHCAAFAGIVGGFLVASAVLVTQSFSSYGLKTIAVYVLLVATNAVSTHAIGRALRLRQDGGEP